MFVFDLQNNQRMQSLKAFRWQAADFVFVQIAEFERKFQMIIPIIPIIIIIVLYDLLFDD